VEVTEAATVAVSGEADEDVVEDVEGEGEEVADKPKARNGFLSPSWVDW